MSYNYRDIRQAEQYFSIMFAFLKVFQKINIRCVFSNRETYTYQNVYFLFPTPTGIMVTPTDPAEVAPEIMYHLLWKEIVSIQPVKRDMKSNKNKDYTGDENR